MDVIELFATDPEPPLDEVALAIARDALPTLDLAGQRAGLDDLAAPLRARAAMLHRPLDQAALLGTYVYDELGFAGDEETYDDPSNSYLPSVVARRRGIPITLAVVLAALGRRAGMDVEGVGFPGHFLVRLGGPALDQSTPELRAFTSLVDLLPLRTATTRAFPISGNRRGVTAVVAHEPRSATRVDGPAAAVGSERGVALLVRGHAHAGLVHAVPWEYIGA